MVRQPACSWSLASVLVPIVLASAACGERADYSVNPPSLSKPSYNVSASGSIAFKVRGRNGNYCGDNFSNWKITVLNARGDVLYTNNFTGSAAPNSGIGWSNYWAVNGYVVADSTAEKARMELRQWDVTTPGWSTQASKDWDYTENGSTWVATGNCEAEVSWTPTPPPAIANVLLSPRYDTLAVGGAQSYYVYAYAADGFTQIFTHAAATWSIVNPSVASFLSTSAGTGKFGVPSAIVVANSPGSTTINVVRGGVSTGGDIFVPSGGSGGGCPPAGC